MSQALFKFSIIELVALQLTGSGAVEIRGLCQHHLSDYARQAKRFFYRVFFLLRDAWFVPPSSQR